jgi:CBS domain-containing protein
MSGAEAKSERRVSCTVDDPLQYAAGIMCDNDCSTVSVVDAHGSVIGAITARDICVAAYRRGMPLWHMDVGSAMSNGSLTPANGDEEVSGTYPVAQVRSPSLV